VTWIVKKC